MFCSFNYFSFHSAFSPILIHFFISRSSDLFVKCSLTLITDDSILLQVWVIFRKRSMRILSYSSFSLQVSSSFSYMELLRSYLNCYPVQHLVPYGVATATVTEMLSQWEADGHVLVYYSDTSTCALFPFTVKSDIVTVAGGYSLLIDMYLSNSTGTMQEVLRDNAHHLTH